VLSFLPEPVKPLRVEDVERTNNLEDESFRTHDDVSDHVQSVGTSVPPTETYAPVFGGAKLRLHVVL
jgi:hypothetical protein